MKGLSKKDDGKDVPDQLPPQEGRILDNRRMTLPVESWISEWMIPLSHYHPILNSLMTSTQNSKGNSAHTLQPWKQVHLKSLAQALSGKESGRETFTNSVGLEHRTSASVGTESKAQK